MEERLQTLDEGVIVPGKVQPRELPLEEIEG